MNRFFQKEIILIFLVIFIGGFFRFYKLDWGQGLFTHPDEYHIVISVNQLSFPSQMHPHFFSYGTVTIYLIYFTQEAIKYIFSAFHLPLPPINSFLIGRFYSALFSTLTIFLIYKISRSFMNKHFSYLAAFLVAVTPGLIQQAHFATPESILTFFLFLSLLFMIKFLNHNIVSHILLASVALGFALGVKISSIVFLFPLIIAIILKSLKNPLRLTKLLFLSVVTVFVTLRLVAPYTFIDFSAFQSNLNYEGGLAIGKISVFYTRQFIDTTPVIFQLEKILPYVLGPALLVFAILGLMSVMLNLFQHLNPGSEIPKQVRNDTKEKILLITAFMSLFIPNAFLFAKWTRFIAPTFPFFAIFSAYLLEKFTNKMRFLSYALTIILLLSTMLWTTAFFSIYTNPDIRITASNWLISYAKERSTFLVEGGNTIDIPLSGNFQKISLDFYALEQDSFTREKIANALYSSDYFLVQSRRVFMNHQRLRHLYPKTARFYDTLFDGGLGFEQIKEFHSYPKLEVGGWKLEVADETAEETWSVFDHPVIRVFKKNSQLTKDEYAKVFQP